MKKILSTLCMALTAAAMFAQDPVITFVKTEHDFGKINEADGRVSVVFEFKNEGMAPLVLSNVRASCGCTTPTWTKEPVEPGKTGSITVTYNPNGRPGRFQKTVTITSNATEPTKKVYIKGEVIPKSAKPANKFTVAVGDINMKSKTLDLGTIKHGEQKSGELEYANLKQESHKVELATSSADAYLATQVTLAEPKKDETGKFLFALDTKNTKLYGPYEFYAYVVVDGKKLINDTYKLTVKVNVEEDFSNMTVEDKQQAPILEVAADFNAGKVAAGKTVKYVIPFLNIGVNPLEVRRAYCTDSHLKVKAGKAVKSGKKGTLAVDINTKGLQPGAYSREIVLITNDYKKSVQRIKLNFTVE